MIFLESGTIAGPANEAWRGRRTTAGKSFRGEW
jgi:hypothetical protein